MVGGRLGMRFRCMQSGENLMEMHGSGFLGNQYLKS